MKIDHQKHMRKLFLVGMIVLAPLCRAGMIGDVVDLTAQFPDIGPGDVLIDPGPKTIDGSVEWPEGTFAVVYSNYLSVQITDTQIVLSFNELYGAFQAGAFNGLEIAFLTGTIDSATPDPASGFNPKAITIEGNDLFLNYQGVATSPGE